MSTSFAPATLPAAGATVASSNGLAQAQEIAAGPSSATAHDMASAAASVPVDQWGGAPSAAANGGVDFLAAAHNTSVASGIDWWHPFKDAVIPLNEWVVSALSWVVKHFRPAFQAIRIPIDYMLSNVEIGLQSVPQPLMLLIIFLIAWRVNGRKLAIGSVLSFVMIGLIGAWSEAMVTLSLVLTSLLFCILIGLPLGIAVARSDRLQEVMRPGLDAMQTTPAFVYLVPVVMLFGIGNVPGVVVTIIFALAPLVRLTNLGIRQVRPDLIEASRSFGASPWQLLVRVQLPLAMPTIMAGVNQALMLSLSMVVIASMIAVEGLGQMVLRGIGRLDMGLATVGGLGIVLMAIVLDRMTQSVGQPRSGV
ncbi:MAG: glycine betaine/L-proline ABC transporter permease ProW [Pseudomonadota bacterium]